MLEPDYSEKKKPLLDFVEEGLFLFGGIRLRHSPECRLA